MTKHKNVALDELRILAALMVLGVHTGQKVGLGDAAAVGAQGVQLFFVLSGYLAAASLSRHPEPLPYYQRRIRLILPERMWKESYAIICMYQRIISFHTYRFFHGGTRLWRFYRQKT